jgi:hypothetical protein
MVSIAAMIPIDISRIPGIMENVFVGADFSPKRFKFTSTFLRSYITFFLGLTRKCQESTHELSNKKSRLMMMSNRSDRSFV